MNGNQDDGNTNINGNKKIIFEDSNSANTSLHEETQNGSQLSIAELNERVNNLLNSINALTKSNSELKEENSKIINDYSKIIKDNSKLKEENTKIINDYSELKKENSKIIQDNSELKEKNSKIINDYSGLKEENSKIINDYSELKEENSQLSIRMKIVEQRLDGLESLVMRNNINVDLLANRDSLKTILLIFSYNLGLTTKEEMKKINNNLFYHEKFTQLLLKVFRKLENSLKLSVFSRPGYSDASSSKTLAEKDKEKIEKQFIFVECIHFIVCSIDNIVHPPENEDNNSCYSKLIGISSKEILEKCLIQFFDNPKTTEDLKAMIKKLKGNPANEDNDMEKKKVDDNGVQEKDIDAETKKEDKKGTTKILNDKKEDKTVEENKNTNEEKDENRKEKNENKKVKDKEVDKKENKEENHEKEIKLICDEIKCDQGNEIKVDNKSKKEENKNENKEEEKKEELKGKENQNNNLQEEKAIKFENYDKPKSIAYLKNKEYFKKLNGKNNYKKEFFIEHLFKPNLLSFSETEMKINCEEFNNYINNELEKFNSLNTGINPFDLLKKLKWLS